MPIILRWKLERALLALIIVVFMQTVGLHFAEAATVFQTPAPSVEISGQDNFQWLNRIRIPLGVTFNKIQLVASGSFPVSFAIYNDNGNRFEDCEDYVCVNQHTQTANIGYTIGSKIEDFLIEYTVATTTINNLQEYLLFFLPNFDTKQTYIGTGYSEDDTNNNRINRGVSLRLCLDTCTSTSFETNIETPTFNVGNNSGNFNTRFISTQITGTSTNPKNVFVKVEYYIDPNELNRNVSATNPTQISLSVALRPNTTFTKLYYDIPLISGTNTQTFTIDDTNIQDNGIFDLLIQFANAGVPFGSEIPFKDSYIYTNFTLSSKIVTATSTTENYNSTTNINQNLTSQPCGITALSGCISNAFSYLFIPDPTTLNNFKSIQTTLSTKFPFAYITDFQSSITTLYNENNTQNSSISVPFGSYGTISLISKQQLENVPFAFWIKTMLGYLLWLMFAYQMYRRTLNIFNPIPQ